MLKKQSIAAIEENEDEDEESDEGEVRPTEFLTAQKIASDVAGTTSTDNFANLS